MALLKQLKETTSFIQKHFPAAPDVGIILGSGLVKLTDHIKVDKEIPYNQIPNFPVSTVEGHPGKLIFGRMSDKTVVAMAGRFHFYEGYSAKEVAYPVQVLHQLGVRTLLISNAAGGVNASYKVGDLMIIRDHISFAVVNPLLGKNEEALGPRFPDMSEPYHSGLIATAKKIAAKNGIPVHEGVYFGVTGPTFETRSEYKMIRILGGDAVGMSTVQEVITAAHLKLQVFAMSVITDIGIREENNIITHKEVLEAARDAEPKLTAIFSELVAQIR